MFQESASKSIKMKILFYNVTARSDLSSWWVENFIYFWQQSFFSPALQGHGQSLTHSQPVPHPAVVQEQAVEKLSQLYCVNYCLIL